MPLSSQLVTIDHNNRDPKRGSACHLRGPNPAVSYRPPTTPPAPTSIGEDPMLEQMDVTESSWPGPGLREPLFPPAPTPAPMPSSMPDEDSRPSSKPKAKKKKKAAKKAAKKKSRPKAKARKKPAKKKKAGKKKRRRYRRSHSPRGERLDEIPPRATLRRKKTCVVRGTWFPSRCCWDALPQRFRSVTRRKKLPRCCSGRRPIGIAAISPASWAITRTTR